MSIMAPPRTRIDLPRWFAGLSLGTEVPAHSVPAAEVEQVGPIHVHQAHAGAELATFAAVPDRGVVVFDGYLFDRVDLCRELRVPDSASYAEIAAAGFQTWGVEFLSRLAGSFLVAVWDPQERRLILGHDALGRHPVFYARTATGFWFGPNVLALAGSGQVSNRPNRVSLALAALTLWPEAGQTFFEEISRLAPGHYVEIRIDGATRESAYWHPIPSGENEWLSEREVIDGFEPALIRAVTRCMELAPDGIMLSGGVDSVTVAALASEYRAAHHEPPIVAVSGRADVPLHHEEEMQARAAQALHMPHLVSRTSEWTNNRNDVDVSLEVTPDLPGPSRIYWVGTYMGFYRRAASHDLHVLLTGAGGDNWLAVADVHAADLIRHLRLAELSRFVRAAARTGGSSYPAALKRLVWRGGIRPLADTLAAKLLPGPKGRYHRRRADQFVPAWLCPDPALRREVVDRILAQRTPSLTPDGRAPRNYYQHSLLSTTNPHLYHEFETAFHVDSLCGLRLLSPYHDRDLVSFFTRIPPAVLVHGNKYKGLLRPVVEKHLPGLGFGTQRKDYPKLATDLDLQNLRQGIAQAWPAFRFDALASLGVVDARAVQEESRRAQDYTILPLVRMFATMSAERWVTARAS